ncbi:MAG TPA: malto-oligosyltrehalose trehalohydrolase [Spartobacteria bacterium]|jgi:maltooligosyltrehalose trehalohydrolase|nr:malto-oligosyltrehalose trehalohydrolase [Spartobacteria bacterium]
MHNQRSARGRKSGVNKFAKRRYPIGAELIGPNKTHFRAWAPKAKNVDLVLESGAEKNAERSFHPLTREDGGYFSGTAEAGAGALYRFRINDAENFHPDPASRFQPQGPHGPSCIVDPTQFKWTDEKWRGVKMRGQIVYEMHIGTFTPEGTWRAAAEQLAELARIGITVIEMMPIADFPGNFGWGYDGVDLFAPTRLYGTPDDLRAFVDRAHSLGLAVILDVVYNHFGPDGNYLAVYSDDYLTRENENDWGDSINFDGANSGPVREFFITNGRYWIDEFHFDGFRFDATQSIYDKSDEYIVGAIGRAARQTAGKRSLILIAENESQETKLVRPRSEGGDDLDGLLNDDFHHSAVVALTGLREAYYTDYLGSPQEFISAAKYGYLFQGQPYSWQEAPRGTPTFKASPEAFVAFIENHDQVANTAAGERLRFQTSPGRYRAMTALLLLGPWTPMLFQGQEFGASSPFIFFTDVGDGPMREAIRKGRFQFLAQFPSLAANEVQKRLPVPSDPKVFANCKLDFSKRKKNKEFYDLHVDLLRLRREDSRFHEQRLGGVDGAVLGPASFVLRYFSKGNSDDRLLVVNFGERRVLTPAPEPLLAPPLGLEWETLWSSESVSYGGPGVVTVARQDGWTLPAEATIALRLIPEKAPRRQPKRRSL